MRSETIPTTWKNHGHEDGAVQGTVHGERDGDGELVAGRAPPSDRASLGVAKDEVLERRLKE